MKKKKKNNLCNYRSAMAYENFQVYPFERNKDAKWLFLNKCDLHRTYAFSICTSRMKFGEPVLCLLHKGMWKWESTCGRFSTLPQLPKVLKVLPFLCCHFTNPFDRKYGTLPVRHAWRQYCELANKWLMLELYACSFFLAVQTAPLFQHITACSVKQWSFARNDTAEVFPVQTSALAEHYLGCIPITVVYCKVNGYAAQQPSWAPFQFLRRLQSIQLVKTPSVVCGDAGCFAVEICKQRQCSLYV